MNQGFTIKNIPKNRTQHGTRAKCRLHLDKKNSHTFRWDRNMFFAWPKKGINYLAKIGNELEPERSFKKIADYRTRIKNSWISVLKTDSDSH